MMDTPNPAPLLHGGRLYLARHRFPNAPHPWIDLSTGINPNAYPVGPLPPVLWQRLPEPEDLAALEAAAARAYGVPDPTMVVAAPGTQALIQLLPRLIPLARIKIPQPTYAEHAQAWQAAGTQLDERPDPEALVLCNPNNPDGARHDPAILAARATTLRLLIVDEAFADFEPGLSLAPFLPLPNTILLRSFGKAYGLAGLRLGFALLDARNADRLRAMLGPWPVSGPAIAIATRALADTAWQAAAARTAHAAARRLDRLLAAAGLAIVGGTALFRLAEAPDAQALADRLAYAGILVRTFAATPTRLRLGLPPDEPAWSRLEQALTPRAIPGSPAPTPPS